MTQSHPSRRSRIAVAGTAGGVLALAGSVVTALPAAAGGGNGCENRNNNTVAKLTECVTLEGVTEHLEAFQEIADDNEGNRASGTPGYEASVEYVEQRLQAAGYESTRQSFEFPFFQLRSSSFSRVTPAPATYSAADFTPMTYTAAGTVDDGVVTPVDLPATGLGSGCETGDFTGFAAGTVALVQRGGCAFAVKAQNAQLAGASAVIVFNNTAGPLAGTLGAPGTRIPVIGVSTALGQELAAPGTTVDLAVDSTSETRTTYNVVAELPGRTSDNVVMAGAHLDSVLAGPGINDNGSGSAAILEVAENMAEVKPVNTVRFAWWGAEELGLLGSEHYVSQLSDAQVADIGLYLNFDMVGSPNFARFIYDGDQSDFTAPVAVPEGSDQIEYVLEDYFEAQGLWYEGSEFSGRSDYQAFIEAEIPSGGLFTGAEVLKQEYQVPLYGGLAGVAYDRNYHQAGDTIGNVDPKALETNSDAIAYSVLTLSYDTSRVNGAQGRPVPGGTFQGDPTDRQFRVTPEQKAGGGGLSPDHDHDHGGEEI
ncbi:Zn-dependent M28 family amino/carboxypeptidase [Geodermatophilus normandii]|uniref:Zn-dependent M28 family amino/carboxypeptidase n=1 Tax=Geodermatophilus normandii TaxID=1137989 RepID=A0A317QF54_9ACTN|nr:M28 family metallopeptidase [Geodermatophilus normandii]PWW21354.1 Zn-dependent M28 family amino/carboxypeptidase [Geodermatophilus normandii]